MARALRVCAGLVGARGPGRRATRPEGLSHAACGGVARNPNKSAARACLAASRAPAAAPRGSSLRVCSAVGFRPGASVRWWRARAWRGRERRVLNTRVALFGDLSSIVKAPSSKHVAHCSGLYSRTDDISIRILGVTGQPLGNTPRKVVPSSYKTSKTGHFLPRPLRPDSVSTP